MYNMNSDAYITGYNLGLIWADPEDYLPGGPFLINERYHGPNSAPCKICEENKQFYDDWHQGFKDGAAKAKAYLNGV